MLLSCQQNACQNWNIRIANRSFGNVRQFEYLGTAVTNQILIQEEIERRLNSGIGCYIRFTTFLSSRLLLKNVKIKIYKTTILRVVLSGWTTWSLTLRGEHRLGGVWEQGAEEDIWTEEEWNDRRVEKTA
jgi:hypothetical protein